MHRMAGKVKGVASPGSRISKTRIPLSHREINRDNKPAVSGGGLEGFSMSVIFDMELMMCSMTQARQQ
jgi:hypothetical protein